MPTTQIVTIGTGRDYASLSSFITWLNSQNLVTDDKYVEAHIYDNQTLSNNALVAGPSNSDLTRYCKIRPATGLSFQELNPGGIFDWPSTGLLLTFNASTFFAVRSSAGIVWEDFRIQVNTTAALSGAAAFRIANNNGGESAPNYLAGARRCIFNGDNTYAPSMQLSTGAGGNYAFAEDCIAIGTGASAAFEVAQLRELTRMERCTIVRRGSSYKALRVVTSSGPWAPSVRDNLVLGGNIEVDYTAAATSTAARAASSDNYTDAAITVINPSSYTAYNAGTFNTGTALVENVASNLRPAAASAIIDTASSAADNSQDINYGNRATAPDVGAIQRTPAIPLPGGSVTTVTVSGQEVTVSGTTTGTVDSATATLPAAGTPNGAITQGPIAVTLGAGTFTVTFTEVPPGSYAAAQVTLTNGGGNTTINAAAGVEILGIDGEPQVPDLEGGGDPPPAEAGELAYRCNLLNDGIVADFGVMGLHKSGAFIPLL